MLIIIIMEGGLPELKYLQIVKVLESICLYQKFWREKIQVLYIFQSLEWILANGSIGGQK